MTLQTLESIRKAGATLLRIIITRAMTMTEGNAYSLLTTQILADTLPDGLLTLILTFNLIR
jgi:hypothetical protein